MSTFREWPKIARLNRPTVITEKVDGTNAAIHIVLADNDDDVNIPTATVGSYRLYAQSRNRMISIADDNYGFAAWVARNAAHLFADLGMGIHYGEWAGYKIGKRYSAVLAESKQRDFWLFNTSRWVESDFVTPNLRVVPVLDESVLFDIGLANGICADQRAFAAGLSRAYPGARIEGAVVYHKAANVMFKVTVDKDEEWKGKS